MAEPTKVDPPKGDPILFAEPKKDLSPVPVPAPVAPPPPPPTPEPVIGYPDGHKPTIAMHGPTNNAIRVLGPGIDVLFSLNQVEHAVKLYLACCGTGATKP
jgi:hypothetical protein